MQGLKRFISFIKSPIWRSDPGIPYVEQSDAQEVLKSVDGRVHYDYTGAAASVRSTCIATILRGNLLLPPQCACKVSKTDRLHLAKKTIPSFRVLLASSVISKPCW